MKTVGRYEIRTELGRGGMATVYRGFDPRFKRDVAIKVLPREFLHDPSFRSRFEREAETIAALEHAAIVPVYDYGEDEGQPFLVMRFMPGGSLADRLERGHLVPSEAARILGRIAAALDRAHSQGIIHRDLKPDNILFDADDEPYISDFGIAKIVAPGEGSFTTTGTVVGSPAYMSPEQARGDKDIDGRSDVYSLGATLFEMLSGKCPYEADTPMSILVKHITDPVPRILEANPSLPPACETLIQKAMAKNREERFATASEMAEMLTAIVEGGAAFELPAVTPVSASPQPRITRQDLPPPTPDDAEPTTKPPTRRATWAGMPVKGKRALAIVALIGTLVVVALAIAFWPGDVTPTVPATSSPTFATESAQTPPATHPQPSATRGEATSESLDPLLTIIASTEKIRAVAFSPDATKLASGGEDRIIRVWDTTSGQELLTLEGHANIVTSLAWSPDGGRLASGSDDETIRIWDAATGAHVSSLLGHTNFVLAVAWSPDGKRLASGGWDRRVIVWDAGSGAMVSSADIGRDGNSVAWAPDGTQLAVSSTGLVLILDPSSGEELQRLTGEWGDSLGVAWSPDGQYLAATGHDRHVHVWQVDHWENGRLLKGHVETVTSVVFSPDSQRLASTAYDVTVRVWDVTAGAELSSAPAIPRSKSSAFSIDWSQDGSRLAAAGSDGVIWIWDAIPFGVDLAE